MKLNRRQFMAASFAASLYGITRPVTGSAVSGNTPWVNWSGALKSMPASRVSPADESELAAFFRQSQGEVRPVGSGHSFSPLVPTDGHLVTLERMFGLASFDEEHKTATFAAGTRLGEIGPALAGIGQAMPNLPDIDRQTLAGATATATHGTGINFQCLSGYITALRLVTPRGDVVDVSRDSDEDLFNAARVNLGALGVVSSITLQNRAPFRLHQKSWVMKIDDALDRFDDMVSRHRHFEIFPLVHSDYALALSTDETDATVNNPPPSAEEEASLANAMYAWSLVSPSLRKPLINGVARLIEPSERIDESWKILANVRNDRFNEMEYSVPVSAGHACLKEILDTIQQKEIDVVFPLEYRYVARDDTWLSMASGDEDHAAISIHRTASEDYRPYFDMIEPIFWKYGGRPHWGKVHSLGAEQLAELYPNFRAFNALRAELDPEGRMLNAHLRKLFGVS